MQLLLKDKTRQIPNGFQFVQAETGWQAPRWVSFDSLVRLVVSHRLGNQWAVKKFNLATDYASVADEVEAYNAKICQSKGWNEFIVTKEGDAPPKTAPLPNAPRLSVVAAGARMLSGIRTLKELFGGKPVAQDLADTRAIQCANCRLNDKNPDLTSIFTIPAARLITEHLRERTNLGLSTPSDPLLGVCSGCSCPLKLKVHTPLDAIKKHLNDEVRSALVPECWVLNEK
jgi:hypothetical protein